MNILVSIIIPVYNVNKYIDRCLESVVHQSYNNLEIIIVNDGSTDNSLEICKKWEMMDSRIRVITKENQGLGMARNTGIINSHGKYIYFLDSDDYISKDLIKNSILTAYKYNADMVTFGFSKVSNDGKIYNTCIPSSSQEYFCGKSIYDDFLPDFIGTRPSSKVKNLSMSAWASLFSAKIIKENNWFFVSERNIISEDIYSLLILIRYINCVAILSQSLYYYCDNIDSLTHTYRKDRFTKINNFYKDVVELSMKSNFNNEVLNRLKYTYLGAVIACLKIIIKQKITLKYKFLEMKKILNDKTLHSVLTSLDYSAEYTKRKILYKIMLHKSVLLLYMVLRWTI